jgi:hypothetical protein
MRRRRGKVALPAAHFDRVQPSLQGQIAMTRRVGLNENRSSVLKARATQSAVEVIGLPSGRNPPQPPRPSLPPERPRHVESGPAAWEPNFRFLPLSLLEQSGRQAVDAEGVLLAAVGLKALFALGARPIVERGTLAAIVEQRRSIAA